MPPVRKALYQFSGNYSSIFFEGEMCPRLDAVACNMVYFEYQSGSQIVLTARARYLLREVAGNLRIVEKRVPLLNCDDYLPAIQLFI